MDLRKKNIEIFKYNKNLFKTEIRNNSDNYENKSLREMTYNIEKCFENAIRKFTIRKTRGK